MSVTSLQIADKERFLSQVDRIIQSHTLRKAESLCKLLRYLADHSLTHPGVPLKEYQIAVEVFGRPENFDPQADSAIRVQAGRLRLKLLDYYAHEGVTDPIIVEMPTGVYSLSFHQREEPKPLLVPETLLKPPVELQPSRRPSTSRGLAVAVAALSVALVLLLAAVAALWATLRSTRSGNTPSAERVQAAVPTGLRTFWNQFASSPDSPIVIFSNAAFVGRPETGMRYMNPVRDSHDLILDHYTGVGEVLAVHDLDTVFGELNHPIDVKRGSLFTLDDAKKSDLIFVGSPAENLTLQDLPGSQEFVFRRLPTGPHKGELGILNVHPEPGQPSMYYPTRSSQPLTEDYAVVTLVPGLNPDRQVLILAGTTTLGTQAAVEYVCEKESVEELLQRLGVQTGDAMKAFEALLRVKVTRGVPVGVQLVATRTRN